MMHVPMKLEETLRQGEGHLQKVEEQQFHAIDFNWEGIAFHAVCTEAADGSCEIRLTGTLGQLYYTVEDAMQRGLAIERISRCNRTLDGVYDISRDGTVTYHSRTGCDRPLLGQELMAALAVILLEAETHLRGLHAHLKPV
ncbi:hypothetical protein [Yunchengibacter salinarum]|uniref:hypothetical protein n=1 Tax=Yunchengibacter salinarum TaxID=3133399 RepID=UPI0035B61BCB